MIVERGTLVQGSGPKEQERERLAMSLATWRAGDSRGGSSRGSAQRTCGCRSVSEYSGDEAKEVFRGWYPGFRPQPHSVAV